MMRSPNPNVGWVPFTDICELFQAGTHDLTTDFLPEEKFGFSEADLCGKRAEGDMSVIGHLGTFSKHGNCSLRSDDFEGQFLCEDIHEELHLSDESLLEELEEQDSSEIMTELEGDTVYTDWCNELVDELITMLQSIAEMEDYEEETAIDSNNDDLSPTHESMTRGKDWSELFFIERRRIYGVRSHGRVFSGKKKGSRGRKQAPTISERRRSSKKAIDSMS